MFFSLSSFQSSEQATQADTTLQDTARASQQADSIEEPILEPDSAEKETQATDTAELAVESSFARGDYSTQQTRRGERLFNGLAPFESGLHDCASCHYTDAQEEINWNPSAWELAAVWQEDSAYSIMEIMNNPLTTKLMEDHAGMTITPEEQHLLEAYYTKVNEQGPDELPAYPVRTAIFWGMGLLMLLAIIDLLFTRKIRFKAVHVIVLFVGIAVHGQFAMAEAKALSRTQDYAPEQPIKFSHLIHAGENEIDCEYCHFTADYSLSANIPSNNVCMNCHTVIRSGTNSGSFEINKIHKAAETGNPVEWVRVHKLPDHSFFSHAQHVNAGKLDCAECHGEVETMHIVKQVEDLSMGWCLTCHRENEVDFLDNPYFGIYERLHEKIRNGEIDGVTAAELGGEDCMSCHY